MGHKYIVFSDQTQQEHIFVFPGCLTHRVMAENFRYAARRDYCNLILFPVSAGFVDDHGTCFGESSSMDLQSRPQDSALLLKA